MAQFLHLFRLAARYWPSLALLIILGFPFGAHSNELPDSVNRALKDAGISPQSVAVVVQSVDADKPIIRYNAQQAMNPASTMKLLTTYAALELLGPAYTWKTALLTDAPDAAGEAL